MKGGVYRMLTYKPTVEGKKNDKKKEVKQQASRHVASVKAQSKKSLSVM